MARSMMDETKWDFKIDGLRDYIPVTRDDDADLPDGPCRALIVAAAGTVNLTTLDGDERDGVPLVPGINPLVAKRVREGGSAVSIFAGY